MNTTGKTKAMADVLRLPPDAVRHKREEIRAAAKSLGLRKTDRLYVKTQSLIRSPAAQWAHTALPECRRLRRKLRALILANRITFVLVITSAFFAAVWSYLLLLAIIPLGLLLYWINTLQTATNFDLAARIEVFSDMLFTDAEFRRQVQESCEELRDILELTASYSSFLESQDPLDTA